MRKIEMFLVFLLCSCQDLHAGLSLNVRRQNDYLVADVLSTERSCIVTYNIYYKRFGLIPVYGKRLGIDVRGECEIDVPAGKSTARFKIEDASFKDSASGKDLCVDVTYYIYNKNNEISLRHK